MSSASVLGRSAHPGHPSTNIVPSSLQGGPLRRLRQFVLIPLHLFVIPARFAASAALDSIEHVVCKLSGAQRQARNSPFLRADWEPQTNEIRAADAPVVAGNLPKELDGAFVRRLLVLQEANMPYALRILCDGAMETIGRVLFNGEYDGPMTAHPKLHPTNGCMYAVSYQFEAKESPIRLQVVDASNSLTRNFPISGCKRPVMMHDMALTEKYVVVMDLPLVFSPSAMVKSGTLPIVFDKTVPARFGLVPVEASDDSQTQWFHFDKSFYAFHSACAYDEGSKVVVWLCSIDDFDLSLDEKPYSEHPADVSSFSKIVLDTVSGVATRQDFKISAFGNISNFDFPQVHPKLVSSGARYCYLLGYDENKEDKKCPIGAGVGAVKFDMKEGRECGRLRFSDRANNSSMSAHGGECIFVPRSGATSEDDGYLATIVYDYTKGKSSLHVYDAKNMSPEPVAIVDAPIRVPSGFHATFIPLEQLKRLSANV